MRNSILFILVVFLVAKAQSQVVVRGPYMQTPTPTSIIFKWRTDVNTSTKVWYGTSPTALNQMVNINNNVTDHTITVAGLSPQTVYYYAVGNNSTILAGQTTNHFFKTNPVPGTDVPVRAWAIGDFGKGNAGQLDVKNSYLNYTGTTPTDVWMWLGDNVYDDGKDAEYQSKVFAYNGFSDIFSWQPFWPCPGNHDYNEVWAESSFFGIPYSNIPLEDHVGPYYDIVDVPQQAEAGGAASQLEVFYSFDVGNVHFLSLNSEVYDFSNTNTGINRMKNWITQDLQQNDKLFTIAYFHQPPYSKGSHNSDDVVELVMKKMREIIIPELENFDIDLVVCGHSHVYERSYLINGHYDVSSTFNAGTMLKSGTNGNLAQGNAYIKDTLATNDEGTVYVVCGNSGSSETAPALNHPVMSYTDGGTAACGSFIMDVYKNRLDGKYLKSNGTIGDEFTILKKNMRLNAIANQVICQGDSLLLVASHTGGSDSISYQWLPGSATGASVYIQPGTTTTYTLNVTDQLTGQVETTTFNVSVTTTPAAVVTISNDSLLTQQGFSYQWYLNGSPVSGANNYYYVPTQSGNYSVQLSQGSCSSISADFPFVSVGIKEFENNFSIFPNPVKTKLTIKTDKLKSWNQFRIVNAEGKEMANEKIKNTVTEINMANYAAGIYVVILSGNAGSKEFKVIKE